MSVGREWWVVSMEVGKVQEAVSGSEVQQKEGQRKGKVTLKDRRPWRPHGRQRR